MIGFNGQYLAAAAIGDMRITAMSQGDKRLIGGWLTDATRAAILSAFGAEGAGVIQATNAYLETIAVTDYARAQRLANYINEDPMLVVSLVEVGKERWLVNTRPAYINTGLYLNSQTDSVYARYMRTELEVSNCYYVFKAGNNPRSIHTGVYFWRAGYYSESNGAPQAVFMGQSPINKILESYVSKDLRFIKGGGYNIENNELYIENWNSDTPLHIFESLNSFLGMIAEIKVEGEHESHFIPMQRTDGTCGMLDIISCQFYPNANIEGSFTIQLTDK